MSYIKKILVLCFFLAFFILFTCISIWRFNTAQIFYYDFGIFARSLWLIANGADPLIYHKSLGEIHFLGDHFIPSLYTLIPLFWITKSIKILLIEQAFSLVASGFIIFLIAKKEELSSFAALVISFAFLIFAGVVNPLVTDWHTEPTASVFLLLFIYLFFYKKNYLLGSISALLFMGWKESNAVSFFLCLIPYFILFKKERIKIIIMGLFSVVWFFLTTKLFIPSLIHRSYFYTPVMPTLPLQYFTQFFNLAQKRKLIINSFISFGFLPALALPFLIPIFGELGIRLIPIESHFQSFSLGMHYNVFLGVFLALGTIYSLTFLPKKQIQTFIVFCLLLTSLFVAKKITSSPILLTTNRTFWNEWNIRSSILNEISCIPSTGSVMSQNNILPHLIQRKDKIYLLSLKYKTLKPDYVAIDLSSGQNPNNFYSGDINDYSQATLFAKKIEGDAQYKKTNSSCKYLLLFKRI